MTEAAYKQLQKDVEEFLMWLGGHRLTKFRTQKSFLLYNFDVNEEALRDEHKQALAAFVSLYKSNVHVDMSVVEVVGHASKDEADRAQDLSDLRAEAVQAELRELGITDNYIAHGVGSDQPAENASLEDPINRSVRVTFHLDLLRTWQDVQRSMPVREWRINFDWGGDVSVDEAAATMLREGMEPKDGFFGAGWSLGLKVGTGTLSKLHELGEPTERDILAVTLGLELAAGIEVPLPGSLGGSVSLVDLDGWFETKEPVDFADFDKVPFVLSDVSVNLTAFAGNAAILSIPVGGTFVGVPLAGIDAVMGWDVVKLGYTSAAGMLFVQDPP